MKSLRLTSLWTLMLATACAAAGGGRMRPAESAGSEAMASAPQGLVTRPPASSGAEAKMASLEAADAAGVTRENAPAPSLPPVGRANEQATATLGVAPNGHPGAAEVAAVKPTQPMMDIEAKLAIEVKDVASSLGELRALVATTGGQILEESLEDSKHERPSARMTARVPSAGAFDFLARLEGTGVVRSRQVNSRDVGKEYFDATLRVRSLEQVLTRYYDLLTKATSIEETMRVEEHIARVSGELESIKGELRWLKDRVARATIRLELYAKGGWIEPVVTPEPKFYPGLRAVSVWDWRGDVGNRYGLGAGISLRLNRHFSIDFDGLQSTKAPGGGFETSLLTLGGEFYSDYLGAGRRRWLNPYLGARAGYGRIDGNNQVLVGGALGLELFKCDFAVLSLDLRLLGAFGDELGSHVLVQPALGVHFAF